MAVLFFFRWSLEIASDLLSLAVSSGMSDRAKKHYHVIIRDGNLAHMSPRVLHNRQLPQSEFPTRLSLLDSYGVVRTFPSPDLSWLMVPVRGEFTDPFHLPMTCHCSQWRAENLP
jgi:hypothetical protein